MEEGAEDLVSRTLGAVRRDLAMGLPLEKAIEHSLNNMGTFSMLSRGTDLTPEEVAEVRSRASEPGFGPGAPVQASAAYEALLEQYAEGEITQTELEQRLPPEAR
jgi:hypothetical protein